MRFTFDTRYFSDRFQGLPVDGYNRVIEKMLDNPNIRLRLNTEWNDIRADMRPDQTVVYTGPIDAYFGHAEGHLGWRTTRFEEQVLATADHQGTAAMNEADLDVPYTRTIEYRHLYPARPYPADRTVIVREYPRFAAGSDEPFYPIGTPEDRARMVRYQARAQLERNVLFGGRLGTYTYLDMHQAIAMALRDWKALAGRLQIAGAASPA